MYRRGSKRYCSNISSSIEFIEKLEQIPGDDYLGVNWLVNVKLPSDQIEPGNVHWLGRHCDSGACLVGVELNRPIIGGGTDGTFPDKTGIKLFQCLPGRGILVPRAYVFVPSLAIISGYHQYYGNSMNSVKVFCDVPHEVAFLEGLISQERPPEDINYDIGYAVEVTLTNSTLTNRYSPTGVCCFISQHKNTKEYFIGVELDYEIDCEAVTNGMFPRNNGIQLFQCKNHRGVLLPKHRVCLDHRVTLTTKEVEYNIKQLDEKHQMTEITKVEENQLLSKSMKYIAKFTNDNGIQGKHNSCYLDATLFAMFAFNDTFDLILSQKNEKNENTVKLLHQSIVNVLRKHAYVPHVNMDKFRAEFETFTGSKGMTCDQKDPEEFLSILFEKLCKTDPFLHYSDGDTAHLLQLFFDCEHLHPVLSIDFMIKATFEVMNTTLSQIPSNLIIQIPRETGSYVGFSKVALDLNLDLESILSPDCLRKCDGCKKNLTNIYCTLCEMTVCTNCIQKQLTSCKIHDNSYHKSINEMELYAILCIEISHYVTYVRIPDPDKSDKYIWLFFDSMNNREGNINIPLCRRLTTEVNDDLIRQFIKESQPKSNSRFDPLFERLVSNAYTLFYRPRYFCLTQL